MTDTLLPFPYTLHGPLPTIPSIFADSGELGARRLIEFLTASIRNANTRASYSRAIHRFSDWCQVHGLKLNLLTPVHAATYIEELGCVRSKPTVKQHLAALRVLGD